MIRCISVSDVASESRSGVYRQHILDIRSESRKYPTGM